MKKNWQRALALSVAALLLLQSGTKTAVALYWQANQRWIAANLCEKRLEERSCCEGSCQLKKWAAVEGGGPAEGQRPPLPGLLFLKEADAFCEPCAALSDPVFFEEKEGRARPATSDRLPRPPFLEALGEPPEAVA